MTTITETAVAKMTDVEKAKLQIEMITTYVLSHSSHTITFIPKLKSIIDGGLKDDESSMKDILISARDTLVDAYEEQCIPDIIAKCVADHNAKIVDEINAKFDAENAEKQRIAAEKQAKADALTETEIADLFDDCLSQKTYNEIGFGYRQLSTLSCSLEVFAAISDNSAAISYFKYYLIDDARITYDLVCEFLEATNHEDAFSDIEDMLSYLRSDFSDAVANKDWEALEDIKERIANISF